MHVSLKHDVCYHLLRRKNNVRNNTKNNDQKALMWPIFITPYNLRPKFYAKINPTQKQSF